MNWKQLYSFATHDERLDLLFRMMQIVEEREHKLIFTGRRWLYNRRRGYQAHFLNDRRGRHILSRAASLVAFGSILVTVSIATFALILHAPPQLSGTALFFYTTSMLGMVAFKPNRLKPHLARS